MPKFPFTVLKPRSGPLTLFALSALAASAAAEPPQVKLEPLHIGVFTEYGKIVEGSKVEAYGSDEIITDQNMSRTCAWLTEEAQVGERLSINAGISGLFWYSLPVTEGLPHTRLLKFATGLPVAEAAYSFGNTENPYLKLHMGFFGYKYNPDATNLGEYLFRSGTYPGYLWTGGWVLVNNARYDANGIRAAFNLLDNHLKVDANIFIERDIEPNFDLSPSVVANYDVGIFELGAGAVFSHFIPSSSKNVTPKVRGNAFYHDAARNQDLPLPQSEFTKPGFAYFGPGDPRNDTLVVEATDPKAGQLLPETDPRYKDSPKYVTPTENGVPNSQLDYYTFKGVKVMGRASVDPLKLLGSDMFEPGAGKLYAEVALLGVKDYPFYYDKKSERMPVMFGFNIPTFKILDQLTVEVEHYKSAFANSIKTEFNVVYPIWDLPTDAKRNINTPDPAAFLDSNMAVKGREWYWSVYARRTLTPGLSLYGQVAHDHTRALNYFANPTYQPFIQDDKDWYWAIRLEAGI
jgi:hypothetical protein